MQRSKTNNFLPLSELSMGAKNDILPLNIKQYEDQFKPFCTINHLGKFSHNHIPYLYIIAVTL